MAITPGKIEVVQPKMYVVSRLYQVISKKLLPNQTLDRLKGTEYRFDIQSVFILLFTLTASLGLPSSVSRSRFGVE